jgi:hypothetical protein
VKGIIFGLILGLAGGYFWGYSEAAARKAHVVRRVVSKFGVSTVERTHRRMDAAIDSTGAR